MSTPAKLDEAPDRIPGERAGLDPRVAEEAA